MADPLRLNPAIMADSYKASHYLQYPPAQLMVAYGEFRSPFNHDTTDTRFVWYGIRYDSSALLSSSFCPVCLSLAPLRSVQPLPADRFSVD